MSSRRLKEWPAEATPEAVKEFKLRGGYADIGGVVCLFCRPTDEQLASLRRGEEPTENVFHGRNIFLILVYGKGGDIRRAYDYLLSQVGEGGVMAKHYGPEYRQWHPDKVRRQSCRGPQSSQQ